MLEYYALKCYQGKDLPLLSVLVSVVVSMLFFYMLDQALHCIAKAAGQFHVLASNAISLHIQ